MTLSTAIFCPPPPPPFFSVGAGAEAGGRGGWAAWTAAGSVATTAGGNAGAMDDRTEELEGEDADAEEGTEETGEDEVLLLCKCGGSSGVGGILKLAEADGGLHIILRFTAVHV